MLSQLMKETVETYYIRAKSTNPLFCNARSGTLNEKNISQYLTNVLYLIQHTPIHLAYARKKSGEKKLAQLQDFFKEKIGEESGHDKWAESDLSLLSKKFGNQANGKLSPHIVELVDYIKEIIDKDPSLYVAYIFLAEYFTVLLGPSWLNDLENRCGIPRTMMSVIGNHAELDKEHVAEDIRQIELLLGKVKDPAPFLAVLKKAIKLHEDFCAEVGKV